jgi:hypothetical protein
MYIDIGLVIRSARYNKPVTAIAEFDAYGALSAAAFLSLKVWFSVGKTKCDPCELMVSVIPVSQISMDDLEQSYDLSEATAKDFFWEWHTGLEDLTALERQYRESPQNKVPVTRAYL